MDKTAEIAMAQKCLDVYQEAYDKEPTKMHETLRDFWVNVINVLEAE